MNVKTEKCVKKGTEDFAQSWLGMYVTDVFQRFKSYVEETEDLSVLEDLDFRNNVSETYRDTAGSSEERGYQNEHVRDFYIIRYAYAYEYEYRKMYEVLLDKLEAEQGDPGTLHITTIGCGNMIDCWGFADALGRLEKNKYHNKYKYEYIYRGIDLIDWGDLRIVNWMKTKKRPDGKEGYYLPGSSVKERKANFVQADVADEIRNGNMTSDVYMFANSISELGEGLLRDFCGSITKSGKDRIFLLTTIGNESLHRDMDLGKVKLMVEELRQRGYDTEDDFENPVNLERNIAEDGQIAYLDIAEGKIMDFLTKKLDPKLNGEKSEENKAHIYPILDAGYLHFLVLSFKKK